MSAESAAAHQIQVGRMSLPRRLMYGFFRTYTLVVGTIYLRLSVRGREHVPENGPFILSAVHRSNLDTPIVSVVTKRRLRYMGKDTMWKYKASAWFFDTMGGFPVHRGSADRQALRACQQVLELGEPLVMFPEGTRQVGPVVVGFYDGPAYVSCRTGAPIVPVGLGGTARAWPKGAKFLRPTKVTVVVGEPLYPPTPEGGGRVPRRVVQEMTEELRERIQALFDEAQRQAGLP
jgi:1-acyl-sn-glycerol-3-phosphate acyltransferase